SIFKNLRDELLQDEPNYLPPSAIFLQIAEKGAQYSAEQIILEKFRFNAIDDRYEGILSAHRNTFSWIFAPEADNTMPLSFFVQCLTSSDDLYWVKGKPGSGTSTLMSYLRTHKETKGKLQEWVQEDLLVLADFFFRNARKKTLQRSQQGLLRALIYQILRQCPELIQQIYPECIIPNHLSNGTEQRSYNDIVAKNKGLPSALSYPPNRPIPNNSEAFEYFYGSDMLEQDEQQMFTGLRKFRREGTMQDMTDMLFPSDECANIFSHRANPVS
ncbi:hypothetical protein CEP53_014939, partial [Fusarium sp. AF-6]